MKKLLIKKKENILIQSIHMEKHLILKLVNTDYTNEDIENHIKNTFQNIQ